MSNRPPHELFPDPGMRGSPYHRKGLTRRQKRGVVMLVLAMVFVAGGGIYSLYDRYIASDPQRDIPMIRPEEGPIKVRPAKPGGIDVPHRDVTIFDRVDQGTDAEKPVEHLLPPSEQPNPEAPDATMAPPPSKGDAAAAPTTVQTEAVSETSSPGLPDPDVKKDVQVNTKKDLPQASSAQAKLVPETLPAATLAPSPASNEPSEIEAKKPEPEKAETAKAPPGENLLPSKDIIEEKIVEPPSKAELQLEASPKAEPKTKSKPITRPKVESKSTTDNDSRYRIQLGASSDRQQADEKMIQIVGSHAIHLRQVKLSVIKADLGARGIFYRIQSQPLAKEAAQKLCTKLKASGLACLLVKSND